MSPIKPLSERERSKLAYIARVIDKAATGGYWRAERLARDFDSGGYPSRGNGERAPQGERSDPTAAAVLALNRAGNDLEPDQWVTDSTFYADLVSAARHVITAGERFDQALAAVNSHSHANPENTSKEQECRNPNCFEVIYTGTGDYPLVDWCMDCYRYLTEHGHERPAKTIRDTNRKREQRKAN